MSFEQLGPGVFVDNITIAFLEYDAKGLFYSMDERFCVMKSGEVQEGCPPRSVQYWGQLPLLPPPFLRPWTTVSGKMTSEFHTESYGQDYLTEVGNVLL